MIMPFIMSVLQSIDLNSINLYSHNKNYKNDIHESPAWLTTRTVMWNMKLSKMFLFIVQVRLGARKQFRFTFSFWCDG